MHYIDYGKEEGMAKNALLVAYSNGAGAIQHVYIGYRHGDYVTLYPYKSVNSAYKAARRKIHVDNILPREQLRLLREEAMRRNA